MCWVNNVMKSIVMLYVARGNMCDSGCTNLGLHSMSVVRWKSSNICKLVDSLSSSSLCARETSIDAVLQANASLKLGIKQQGDHGSADINTTVNDLWSRGAAACMSLTLSLFLSIYDFLFDIHCIAVCVHAVLQKRLKALQLKKKQTSFFLCNRILHANSTNHTLNSMQS